MQSLVIVGAGGHAKVVAEAAKLAGYDIKGFIDRSADLWGDEVLGIPVLGDEDVLNSTDLADCEIIIAIGDNVLRASVAERVADKNMKFATVVHPSSVMSSSATVGEGTVVLAGCVVNSMARIGRHCIINTMTSVDHDCFVGDLSHLSPGVHLAGNCYVRSLACLGIGVSVLPGITIGSRATVGAGAVVTGDIPADAVAVGIPAKVVK